MHPGFWSALSMGWQCAPKQTSMRVPYLLQSDLAQSLADSSKHAATPLWTHLHYLVVGSLKMNSCRRRRSYVVQVRITSV